VARCIEAKLPEQAFYFPPNRIIYGTLCEMYAEAKPISAEILIEELGTAQMLAAIGGVPYIVQVSARIPTTAQAGYFIEKVRELYILRELIKVSTSAVEQCFSYTGELGELIASVEQALFKVTQAKTSDTAKSAKERTPEAVAILQKLFEARGQLTGLSSGFKDLDQLTFGFQPAEMVVIAGRPGTGKTSLCLNIADGVVLPHRAGVTPVPTLIFSLEMSAAQLMLRLYCARARVNLRHLREGILPKNGPEKSNLVLAMDEIAKSPLYIDDSAQLTVMEIRAKARRLSTRHQLGLVIVDYLQLVASNIPRHREEQVADISRGMKAMAKELNVPVIVLSQLNRASEKEGRRPRLSDLRESGSIEQDADVVLMLAPSEDEAAGAVDLIVAKQRNGPIGDLKLTFLRDITKFENYAQ
jgi:replicative DNA helicase